MPNSFNILVTGANGQLGSEIKHLVDNSFFKMDPRVKPEDDEKTSWIPGSSPRMTEKPSCSSTAFPTASIQTTVSQKFFSLPKLSHFFPLL